MYDKFHFRQAIMSYIHVNASFNTVANYLMYNDIDEYIKSSLSIQTIDVCSIILKSYIMISMSLNDIE